MKKNLMNPSADKRPLSKHINTRDILDLDYQKALEALLDYDGPIRLLLESLISTENEYAHVHMTTWRKEAKAIMNVVYKVNGLTQRWEEAP